jgi:5-methylcytosine-specific restriction protein A
MQPATYLLTWNPHKYGWPSLQSDCETVNLGFAFEQRWSCGKSKKPRVGDRVFLTAVGSQVFKGIMASGWVLTEPFEDAHWNENAASLTSRYIFFRYDVLLNPELQPLLNPKTIPLNYNWTPQSSGITIPHPVAELLEEYWRDHIAELNLQPLVPSDSNETYVEGWKDQVIVDRYEHDPQAREMCLKKFGSICRVCGFDFRREFGEIGEGFIQVHHISQRHHEHTLIPEKDLVPVCPNCHAMLHHRNPPYTVDELRQIKHQAKTIED